MDEIVILALAVTLIVVGVAGLWHGCDDEGRDRPWPAPPRSPPSGR